MSQLIPQPITPPPGVVKTESSRIAEGRWIDSDKVRFVHGRPQKIGGWTKQTTTAASGLIHTMHNWRDLAANNYIAAGTYRKLYVYDTNFVINDVTPFRLTGTLGADPFTTTSGSPLVSVAHAGHGLVAGDTIIFTGATTFNGLTLNGTFIVTAVTNANAYVFNAGANASGTGSGGGAAVDYSYEINIGTELDAFGLGWGVGAWGLGTWGSAHSSSTIVIEARVWSLDHFGKILLATYNSGSIYTFDPTAAQPWPRAAIIATSPTDTRALVVTPERFVFALRDLMILSSCSQGDYNDWTPSSSNTAFSRTLTEGSRLVAGRVLAPFVTLVWTDAALYMFQYTGSQFVYNSSLVATNCGLIGPNAAITTQGRAYWMGSDQLWTYNGSVVPMPNSEDVRHFVFPNLQINRKFETFAVYNPVYNEIYFGYCDQNSSGDSPNRYLLYSLTDEVYAVGTLTRVAGHNFTQGDTRPYFADSDGFIYLHENGNDDNVSALPWTLTLGPVAMQEGMYNLNLEAILFDFFEQSGDVTATVNTYDRLNDATVMDTETETVVEGDNPYTEYRVNGRYLGLVLSQSSTGTYFRLGKPVAMLRRDGRRS